MAVELLKGNVALAEAAIRAGVEAYFGYPITPRRFPGTHGEGMPELKCVFIQESEVAWINMVMAQPARARISFSIPASA
jgi:2-oxoglutarate ferredoxin oxidoreductase subunit alpha